MPAPAEALPDVLKPGLDLVICGTAAGNSSAAEKAYYAHPGNRFWRILAETGLTPCQLTPHEFERLPEFGIGLTDIAKRYSGTDAGLEPGVSDFGRFRRKIEEAQPRVLAFNGKKAASIYFGVRIRKLDYGLQPSRNGETVVFVLTQTSGQNGHWKPEPWRDCARFVRKIRAGQDVSPLRPHDAEKVRAAIAGLKAFQKTHSLGGLSVRRTIEEARKY